MEFKAQKKKSLVTFEPWKQQWKVKTNNRLDSISKFQYTNGHFMLTLKLYLYMHGTLFTEQYSSYAGIFAACKTHGHADRWDSVYLKLL